MPEVIDLSECGLSKNGPELMTDWGLITLRARSVHPENECGITLSSLDEDFRERWERHLDLRQGDMVDTQGTA